MYELLTTNNMENYFEPKSHRAKEGVYFYRIIGYDEELLKFLRKYQTFAQRKGTYINSTIKNPDSSDVQYLCTIINNNFSIDFRNIKLECANWLKFLNDMQIDLISKALYTFLSEMAKEGININIIKNSYIKFLYWAKYKFENSLKYIGQDEIPKILYEGDIGKYELYMLRILSLAGCDIIYINFLNEESYMNIDIQGKYSNRIVKPIRQNPPIHFSKIDLRQIEEKNRLIENIKKEQYVLNTNNWMKKDFWEEFFTLGKNRNNNVNEISNIFVKYIGIDNRDEYNNRLYEFKENLIKNGKNYVIIENEILMPTLDEIYKLRFEYKNKDDISLGIIEKIGINIEEKINQTLKKEMFNLVQASEEDNPAKIYNMTLKLLCWINKYCKRLFNKFDWNNLPTLIYLGDCTTLEATFLNIMSKLPLDILYINPNKENVNIFNETLIKSESKIVELENSISEKIKYPRAKVKISTSTVAYNAERELDTILYNNTGMYRDKQFKTCQTITLKTTYEEIAILWKEEAKYRTGFEVEENRVTVPNIFAKVSGVKDSDTNAYLRNIQDLVTEQTIVIQGFPYIKKEEYNEFYSNSNKFMTRDKINIEKIKELKEYKYAFLNGNTQNLILSKIQELIDLKLLEQNDLSISSKIAATLLNINKEILKLIQQFDFTKQIPKIIIMDTDENIASLQDCILLLFLNLIGFDIVIFTPTGYQNIEKYIDSNLFEEYQIGDYIYNLQKPKFNMVNQKKGKSFRKFFRL